MPNVQSRVEDHERDYIRSHKNLTTARLDTKRQHGYKSDDIRKRLGKEFSRRNHGLVAYEWQIDVAEALLLGLDCSVIAGTGAGKTMPFAMPLFVTNGKMVIVISPLNCLEEDQATRFNAMGLSAVAVNGETYSDTMHQDVKNHKYNIIITSPEMCLEHEAFRSLLSDAKFASSILSIVVDEAHCISQ